MLAYLGGYLIVRGIENRHTGVFHLVGDGVAKEDNHHHRHHKQNEHSALVAENMIELLADK